MLPATIISLPSFFSLTVTILRFESRLQSVILVIFQANLLESSDNSILRSQHISISFMNVYQSSFCSHLVPILSVHSRRYFCLEHPHTTIFTIIMNIIWKFWLNPCLQMCLKEMPSSLCSTFLFPHALPTTILQYHILQSRDRFTKYLILPNIINITIKHLALTHFAIHTLPSYTLPSHLKSKIQTLLPLEIAFIINLNLSDGYLRSSLSCLKLSSTSTYLFNQYIGSFSLRI